MQIHGVEIVDTFAEAFAMSATRILITAEDSYWARQAAESMTGFATSIIGCGCEADIERELAPTESPDGRPGFSVLIFSVSGQELQKQLARRLGQCVLTCPSTSVFSGMDGEKRLPMGDFIRYFGDGSQQSKIIGNRRFWRVPVMDGEFLCEASVARQAAVGGGNFILLGCSLSGMLAACRAAVTAMRELSGVIMPFPGGVTRSGSKVGSKYRFLRASTNEAFCPGLRTIASSLVPSDCSAALEVVIDGLSEPEVALAMRIGILAACEAGSGAGLQAITAGNYGGSLGQYHLKLHGILQ
jgi:formylmethanofuran--tetrahydromethanopterin N-formyltransferase